MDLNPVIIAIPIFFGLMAAELVYEAITKKVTYRLNDAVTNINLGVLNQVTGIVTKLVTVGCYSFLYQHFAFVELGQTIWAFAALFVLYDFCFYWSHRMSHEISLFWGGHVVHHQSEDFNLSVALRQSSTSFIWSLPFYMPLAFLGFHPVQFVMVAGINLLYQFWIHTEHIGKLGWFGLIMNTPSHHRVHHGRDAKYIDQNYAGVFIIWDRLFGTFVEEEETPTYGITKPLESWNPVYANFAHYIDLFRYARYSNSWNDTFNILFQNPGWLPEYLQQNVEMNTKTAGDHKYNADIAFPWLKVYAVIQFLIGLAVTTWFLFHYSQFQMDAKLFFAGWIVYTSLMLGFMFERQSWWLVLLEIIRLAALPAGYIILIS